MDEAASSRRERWHIGDLIFSVTAGALGFALLAASGSHLFAASYAAIPQASVAQAGRDARSAVVAPLAAPPVRDDFAPAKVMRRVASAGRSALPRAHASHPIRSARRPARQASLVPVKAVVILRLPPRVRSAPVRVSRLAAHDPRPIAGVLGKRAVVIAAAPRGSRDRSVSPRLANRARALRRRSVVEPPLGYEAQPALVVVPAVGALQLGDPVIPSIVLRRRHV